MPTSQQTISTALLGAVLAISTGCGGGTYAEISGSVEGININPTAYFYGGPFLVFTSRESECEDMAWVKRGSSFESGGEPPTDYDMKSLLFTYGNDEVVAENVNLEGESLIDARVLVVTGGAMAVYRSDGGYIEVTEFTKKGHVVGDFDITFENGSLTGDFEVEDCNNLKADR